MNRYQEKFPVGTKIRVAEREFLEGFMRSWKYHHRLEQRQLDFAGAPAVVSAVGFYHGGDVLYNLAEIPGTWHEVCLCAAGLK
jgi:hypothetical protein